jgi:alpha-methylacyl-CoA racemase
VRLLADADTCVAPVLSIPEVADDPHVEARGAVVEAQREGERPFRQLGPLLAGTVRQTSYPLPDPEVTATAELLAGAGLSPAEIEALAADGVIA